LWIAYAKASLHDPSAAQLALNTIKPEDNNPVIGVITHLVRARMAADAGDGLRDWSGSQIAYANAVVLAPDLPAA
jgi:hypothetical protein